MFRDDAHVRLTTHKPPPNTFTDDGMIIGHQSELRRCVFGSRMLVKDAERSQRTEASRSGGLHTLAYSAAYS